MVHVRTAPDGVRLCSGFLWITAAAYWSGQPPERSLVPRATSIRFGRRTTCSHTNRKPPWRGAGQHGHAVRLSCETTSIPGFRRRRTRAEAPNQKVGGSSPSRRAGIGQIVRGLVSVPCPLRAGPRTHTEWARVVLETPGLTARELRPAFLSRSAPSTGSCPRPAPCPLAGRKAGGRPERPGHRSSR